jgi:transposase
VAAQGREGLKQLLTIIADEKDARLPIDARASLIVLAAQLRALHTMIGSIEKRLIVQHRANEASKRLQSIHGIDIIGASGIAATVTDPKAFRSGRDFLARRRSGSWPSHSPTSWPALRGHCWPAAATTGHGLRQHRKGLGNGRIRLRPCVS